MSEYFNFNEASGEVKKRFQFSKLPRFKFNKKILPLLLILAIGIPLTVTLSQREQDSRSRANEEISSLGFDPYEKSLLVGRIKPANEILQIDINFKRSNNPSITVLGLKKKKGQAPALSSQEKEFNLVVKNDSKVLYRFPFNSPTEFTEPPQDKNIKHQAITLDSVDFSLTVPFFNDATSIEVTDSRDRTLLVTTLNELVDVQNTPRFKSIKGDEFQKMKKINVSPASTNPQFLDVTFIGDNYSASEMDVFHTDVDSFISTLLSYEPFNSRSTQVIFHYVDNTSDLNCLPASSISRLIMCDFTSVVDAINTAGSPSEQIVVIVKSDQYGGSGGGNMSVAYNGELGPLVFVHEFGHSFGNLIDEYILYDRDGFTINSAYANCYRDNPPAAEWVDIVSPSDYFLGCSYPNWYRSSENSMMLTLGPPFNLVSQKLLNAEFDYYISSTPTPTYSPIPSSTPSPTPTPSPSPTLTPVPTPANKKTTLIPVGDTFVRSSAPNANFGKSISVETDSSPVEISYLKFNLASLAGKNIKKATLRIKVGDPSGNAQALRKVQNVNWNEGTINFNNRPKLEGQILTFIPKAANKTINFNVMGFVNDRKGGNATFGITSAGDNNASFYSRESSSGNRPQLIIEYQ